MRTLIKWHKYRQRIGENMEELGDNLFIDLCRNTEVSKYTIC